MKFKPGDIVKYIGNNIDQLRGKELIVNRYSECICSVHINNIFVVNFPYSINEEDFVLIHNDVKLPEYL